MKEIPETIDLKEYSVKMYPNSLTYVFGKEKHEISYAINTHFEITHEEPEVGGEIKIKFKDRWGSEMIFIHYAPSDMKGMFDFIGKGYNIFESYKRDSALFPRLKRWRNKVRMQWKSRFYLWKYNLTKPCRP